MIQWLKRRRQRPVPLTVREIELLAEANDEARRQAMPDRGDEVLSVTTPWMRLASMPRIFPVRTRTAATSAPMGQGESPNASEDQDAEASQEQGGQNKGANN